MATGKVRLERGAQSRAAADVISTQDELRRELRSIKAGEDSLRAHYTGQSATAFFSLLETWQGQAKALVNDFSTFAQRLQAVDAAVEESEAEGAATFARVDGAGFTPRIS